MIELTISDEEVKSGEISPEHLDQAVQAIADDGYVVLHNTIDLDHVDRIWHRMRDDYLDLAENDPDADLIQKKRGNQPTPKEPEFIFADIVQNPFAARIIAAVMGERPTSGTYSSNVSLPGCGEQPLHVDQGKRKPEAPVGGPCPSIVMNIPLNDFTVENGATEVWPNTQFTPCEIGSRHPTEAQQNERIAEGKGPERAVMPRGAVLLRDMRLWHRGPSNNTQTYRPMLSMICNGGFDPKEKSVSDLACAGTYAPEAKAIFDQGPIVYNVESTEPEAVGA